MLTVHVAVALGAATSLRHYATSAELCAGIGWSACWSCNWRWASATWIVKYGWPAWLGELRLGADIRRSRPKAALQALITTAHVATGSLILATSLLVALRSCRAGCDGRSCAGAIASSKHVGGWPA